MTRYRAPFPCRLPGCREAQFPCPVRGCQQLRRREHVMCAFHWDLIPDRLRKRIWTLYRRKPGGRLHMAAIRSAIEFVRKIEREPAVWIEA